MNNRVEYDYGILTYFKNIDGESKLPGTNIVLRNPKTKDEIKAAVHFIREASVHNNFNHMHIHEENFDKRVLHHQINVTLWQSLFGNYPKELSKDEYYESLAKSMVLFNTNSSDNIRKYAQYFDFINSIKRMSIEYKYWDIVPISLLKSDASSFTFYMNRFRSFGSQLVHLGNNIYIEDDKFYNIPTYNESFSIFKRRVTKYIRFLDDHLIDKAPGSNLIKTLAKTYDGYNFNLNIIDLMSIFELMLTHNPSNDKYHIENSINRQFRYKMLTILYINDKSIHLDIEEILLNALYDYRSKYAHGNISEFKGKSFTDKIKNHKKVDEKRIDEFVRIIDERGFETFFIERAIYYILILIDSYLEHDMFIQKIKTL